MTTQESHRATTEARSTVGSAATPVSPQQTALHKYLAATAYGSGATPVSTVPDHAPPTAKSAGAVQQLPETPSETPALVVVGIDGSGCARQAADWAAAEAVHRHAELKLVFAYHLPPAGAPGYNPYPPHLLADLREDGTAALADTAAAVHRRYPTLVVSESLVYGDPVTVLRHASGAANLTVVGTHGRSRMTVALGSVAASVAASSPSPVAVIHPGEINRNGPIVVGVDGSPTSRAAMSYAFRAAADRNATLIAVHCWTDPSIDGPVPEYSSVMIDPAAIRFEEQYRLATELHDFIAEYPSVHVKQTVVHSRPAAGLLGFAEAAQLMVTGSHGHRGMTGLLLGSTSQALIAHSSCPVVVVRASRAADRQT